MIGKLMWLSRNNIWGWYLAEIRRGHNKASPWVKWRLGLCERAIDFIFRGSSIGISYEVVNLSKFINVWWSSIGFSTCVNHIVLYVLLYSKRQIQMVSELSSIKISGRSSKRTCLTFLVLCITDNLGFFGWILVRLFYCQRLMKQRGFNSTWGFIFLIFSLIFSQKLQLSGLI
jgi:hypothetical protein